MRGILISAAYAIVAVCLAALALRRASRRSVERQQSPASVEVLSAEIREVLSAEIRQVRSFLIATTADAAEAGRLLAQNVQEARQAIHGLEQRVEPLEMDVSRLQRSAELEELERWIAADKL